MTDENDLSQFSGRRVSLIGSVLLLIGFLFELGIRHSLNGALSLTVAGAVAIINLRWLEGLLQHVIQPGEPDFDRYALLRIFGRMLLFGALLLTLLWVPQVEPVAVALGVSAMVIALLIEGFRWARTGGG